MFARLPLHLQSVPRTLLLARGVLQSFKPPTTRSFAVSSATMSKEYKLKVETVDLKNGQKVEAQVEGFDDAKVLLLKVNDQLRALGANCSRTRHQLMRLLFAHADKCYRLRFDLLKRTLYLVLIRFIRSSACQGGRCR